MSNFRSAYFDDYEFEPDTRSDDPLRTSARNNVERAYHAHRNGMPLFIFSASSISPEIWAPHSPWRKQHNHWTQRAICQSREQYEQILEDIRWIKSQEAKSNHVGSVRERGSTQRSDEVYENVEEAGGDVESTATQKHPEEHDAETYTGEQFSGVAVQGEVSDLPVQGSEGYGILGKSPQRKMRRSSSMQPLLEEDRAIPTSSMPATSSGRSQLPARPRNHIRTVDRPRLTRNQDQAPVEVAEFTPRHAQSSEAAYSLEAILTAKRMSTHAQLVALETLSDEAEDSERVPEAAAPPTRTRSARPPRRRRNVDKQAGEAHAQEVEGANLIHHGSRIASTEQADKGRDRKLKDGHNDMKAAVERPQSTTAHAGLPTPDDSGEDAGLPCLQMIDDTYTQASDEAEKLERYRAQHIQLTSREQVSWQQDRQHHERSGSAEKVRDKTVANEPQQVRTKLAVQQPEQYTTLGFTAVNSSAFSMVEAAPFRARSTISPITDYNIEDTATEAPKTNTSKAVKSRKGATGGRALKPVASKAQRSCHECHTTESVEWKKGPDGPATLCGKCGRDYYNLQRRQARAAAKAKPKQVLELANISSTEARAVLSPRKPDPRTKKTSVKAPPQPQLDSRTPARSTKGKPEKSVSSSAWKSLNFGKSPHEDVLRQIFRKALDDATRLNGKLDELVGKVEYQRLVDARLGPLSTPSARTPLTKRANDKSTTTGSMHESVMKNKSKRMMTFDTPPVAHKDKRRRTAKSAVATNDNGAQHGEPLPDDAASVPVDQPQPGVENAMQEVLAVPPTVQDTSPTGDDGIEVAKSTTPTVPFVERTPKLGPQGHLSTGKLSSPKRQQATPKFLSSSAPLQHPPQHITGVAITPEQPVMQSTQALLMQAGEAMFDGDDSSIPPPLDATTNTPTVSAAKVTTSSRNAAATPFLRRGVTATIPLTAQSAVSPQSSMAEEEDQDTVPADTQAMLNGLEWQEFDSPYVSYVSPTINRPASIRNITFQSSPLGAHVGAHDTHNDIEPPTSSAISTNRKKGVLKSARKSKSTCTPLSQGLFNFSKITNQSSQRAGSQDSQSVFDIDAFLDETNILDTSVHLSQR